MPREAKLTTLLGMTAGEAGLLRLGAEHVEVGSPLGLLLLPGVGLGAEVLGSRSRGPGACRHGSGHAAFDAQGCVKVPQVVEPIPPLARCIGSPTAATAGLNMRGRKVAVPVRVPDPWLSTQPNK